MTAVQFQNPTGNVIEKVAIVRDGDDRAFVLLDVMLQPRDGLRIQVVRRLVEKQNVRFLQQEAGTTRRGVSLRRTRH